MRHGRSKLILLTGICMLGLIPRVLIFAQSEDKDLLRFSKYETRDRGFFFNIFGRYQ